MNKEILRKVEKSIEVHVDANNVHKMNDVFDPKFNTIKKFIEHLPENIKTHIGTYALFDGEVGITWFYDNYVIEIICFRKGLIQWHCHLRDEYDKETTSGNWWCDKNTDIPEEVSFIINNYIELKKMI